MSERKMTPLQAIRAKCLDCQAGSFKEVRDCRSEKCSLWSYRFGKNPNRKGIGGNPNLTPKTNNLSCKRS